MSETVLVVRKRLLPYSETFVAAQARSLPGFRALFAGLSRTASGLDLLQDYPVLLQDDYARIPALARGLLSATGKADARWLAAIRARSPSLVHAHFGPSGRLGLILGRALDIPVVVTFHGYDITRHSIDKRYYRQRQQVFMRADRIIAVSDFIRRKLIEAGCPQDKISRHYIGLDLQACQQSPPAAKSSEPHLVFVARLVAQKGCADLIHAMKTIRARHKNAKLDIIGDGPELQTLQQQAAPIGGIRFRGRLPPCEVRQALERAWLLCNPSIIDPSGATEGLGMVFLEAQAVGTPAVSYDTGGVPEAIVDGVTGYTVAHADRDALSARLLELIDNPALRQSMGQAARAHIAAHFDLHKQGEKLETLYRSLMQTG